MKDVKKKKSDAEVKDLKIKMDMLKFIKGGGGTDRHNGG